jgi:hypothetical protein
MTLNNIELWKLILSAAIFVFTTITGPILWMMRSQSKAVEAELKLLRGEISLLGAELRKEMAELGAALRKEMGEMEKRLNERIDTRLVHR